VVPGKEDRDAVHRIIYEELGRGIISESSRELYRSVIGNLHTDGAEGVILGCTEIPLLIRPEDCSIPTFDTTMLHAAAAVEWALGIYCYFRFTTSAGLPAVRIDRVQNVKLVRTKNMRRLPLSS